MGALVKSHWQLDVYKKAFDVACSLMELSRAFPREETNSLIDQIRRASRSVCANFAEGWRKRCYEAAFISKLCDAEGEAAECQVWIQFAVKCGYVDPVVAKKLFSACDEVIRMFVSMRVNASDWVLPPPTQKRKRASQ
jgi:four helix bundle protein